jgi:hypothetical protein
MDNSDRKPLPLEGIDIERLIAERRERIIELEARGMPAEGADELWDVLSGMLEELKRHQALAVTNVKSPV